MEFGEEHVQELSRATEDTVEAVAPIDIEEDDGDGMLLEDVSGGFLGDLEEIDEDEDVERFMSQNHTPSVSTRQTPVPASEDDEDSDGNFESIGPPEHQQHSQATLGDEHELIGSGSVTTKTTTKEFELSDEELKRLCQLQAEFRKKLVPKAVEDGVFFTPETYMQYTVISANRAPSQTIPNHSVSGERNAENGAQAISSPLPQQRPGKPPKTSDSPKPATMAATVKRQKLDTEQADVVDTLLDAMKPPTQPLPEVPPPETSNNEATTESKTSTQDIPNDILVAMMAVEGITPTSEGPNGPTKAVVTKEIDPHTAALKEMASKLLPKGFKGPFSQLSVNEHRQFLSMSQRRKAGNALVSKDQIEYQRLKSKVDSEQLKFKSQAQEKTMELLKQMKEPICETAMEHLLRTRATEMYPAMYRSGKAIAITSAGSERVPLEYRGILVQKGGCFQIEMPKETTVALSTEDDLCNDKAAPMSQDAISSALVGRIKADVAISADGLIELLTLPQSHAQETIIPFSVKEDEAGRRTLTVDDPLLPTAAATPRRLNQMYYSHQTRKSLEDRSRALKLTGGPLSSEMPDLGDKCNEESNSTYTLWTFGGLQLIVRYQVDGFITQGEDAAKTTTTVTLATKLEYQLGGHVIEAALAAGGGGGGSSGYEENTEKERLAWWMSSHLRGDLSEVWVAHVDVHKPAIVKVSRKTYSDLNAGVNESTAKGVFQLLQEMRKLEAGQYMLVHRTREWDVTVFRAFEGEESQSIPTNLVLDLAKEMGPVESPSMTQLSIGGDYVPAVWNGRAGQIPYTYAPSDLAPFCSPGSTAKGGSKKQQQQQQQQRRWGAGAKKKFKKAHKK